MIEGASLYIHDPKVTPEQISNDLQMLPNTNYNSTKNEISEKGCWNYISEIEDSLYDADAIIIITEWNEYKIIDWELAEKRMRKPAWIFDTRSIVEKSLLKNTNFKFWSIGNDGSNN